MPGIDNGIRFICAKRELGSLSNS